MRGKKNDIKKKLKTKNCELFFVKRKKENTKNSDGFLFFIISPLKKEAYWHFCSVLLVRYYCRYNQYDMKEEETFVLLFSIFKAYDGFSKYPLYQVGHRKLWLIPIFYSIFEGLTMTVCHILLNPLFWETIMCSKIISKIMKGPAP